MLILIMLSFYIGLVVATFLCLYKFKKLKQPKNNKKVRDKAVATSPYRDHNCNKNINNKNKNS